MRKILILIAVAAATSASAQEAGKKTPRIAVIDMDRVGSDSILGKNYTAQVESLQNDIEAERTKKQQDLAKFDAEIKALQDELEKQGALLSEEAAEKKQAEIKAKAREREAFLEDGRNQLERMAGRAQNQAKILQNELQQKIKPHMESVAREQGVDLLLDSRSAIALNNEFDISAAVIARLDEAERTAGTKPAAAKPAAQATPAKK
jgi:outer membrane protein